MRGIQGDPASIMTFGYAKRFRLSRRGLARRFDLYDLGLAERVSTVEVDVGKALLIDGEARTLTGSVIVDAALARIVFELQEKGTLEQDLTAIPAVVALPVALLHLLFDIVFSQPNVKESADLT